MVFLMQEKMANEGNEDELRGSSHVEGGAWFQSVIPRDLPWGDDELLDLIPAEAEGGFGVKVAQGVTIDGIRYEAGQYIMVNNKEEFAKLLSSVPKVEGLIIPGYKRLVPTSLGMPHTHTIDLASYRKRVGGEWLKAFAITGGLVGVAFALPQFRLLGLIGAMMFGLFPLVDATMAWARRVDRLSVADLNRRLVNDEFFRRWLAKRPTGLLKVAVGILILVFVGQIVVDGPPAAGIAPTSLLDAALVKQAVLENGEWWRLLTTGLMHGSVLHILFNGMALFSLGRVVTALVSPYLLSVVFLVSVVTGSLASLYLSGAPISVGASGGILGCLAFLLVVTQKFHRELPNFLRSSLIQSTIVVSIFGILGVQFIDNAAHAGGFLGGLAIGILGYRWLRLASEGTPPSVRIAGIACNLVLLAGVVKVGWELFLS